MTQKTKWVIDSIHSEIGFKVKHMMFTNVSGKLIKYSAIVETDTDDFANAIIDFTAEVDSITTGSADRDAHLLSPDFFDAAQFPKINFVATSFVPQWYCKESIRAWGCSTRTPIANVLPSIKIFLE